MMSFALHSLLRAYGWRFIWNVAIPYPRKVLQALAGMRKLVFVDDHVDVSDQEGTRIDLQGPQSLIGVGFCLKPMACPSGRFNHDCISLESTDLKEVHAPCVGCEVRKHGERALQRGCTFYIMTSARDILDDVFLPALRERRFVAGRFLICRYSFKPFALGMLVSGIRGRLVAFESGDCRDYRTWVRADVGIKDEQTSLSQSVGVLMGIEKSQTR